MAIDFKDPQSWRFRAEEVLSLAEGLEHVAEDYDRIAQLVERQREREKK